MRITIINRQRQISLAPWLNKSLEKLLNSGLERALKSIAGEEEDSDLNFSLCLSFLGTKAMTGLNSEQRGIDQLTDVLSFPSFEFQEGSLSTPLQDYDLVDPFSEEREIFLGDIVISPFRAEEQAEELDQSLEREIAFLALHGLLHLLGYDHEEEAEAERMFSLQRELIQNFEDLTDESAELDQTAWQAELADWREQLAYDQELPEVKKAGFIALIGRANVGKSTLLNQINGQELAITSYKPQTTRTLIRSVVYEKDCQMAFLDVPGIHPNKHALDRYMSRAISLALQEADIICLLIDARFKPRVESVELRVAKQAHDRGKPLFLLLNKSDIADKEAMLPLIAAFSEKLDPDVVIPISALTGDGLDILYDEIARYLPASGPLFAVDDYTNQTESELVAELIRQQVLLQMQDEIPHGTAVVIDSFEEDTEQVPRHLSVAASIVTERQNHKGMLLGKKGSRIKQIRLASEDRIEEVLDCSCDLELYVRVKDGWRNRPDSLNELGYKIQEVEIE